MVGRRDPNLEMLVNRLNSIDMCMLLLHKMTNHFSVTCPFWTRFMLKPTVGIELSTVVSKRTCVQQSSGLVILNSELAALGELRQLMRSDDTNPDRTYG